MTLHKTPKFAAFLLALLAASFAAAKEAEEETAEAPLLADIRQLTFEGARAGEGYFSADGSMMIFQSEREPGNPFFQIYVMDMQNGGVRRISPGFGKATCGWIGPDGKKAIFASAHEGAKALEQQKAELAFRASGQKRRYSWDFDEQFEIYERDLDGGATIPLTKARGYDAEGAYSPDGKQIVFASNRLAYAGPLTDEERKMLERDPAYFMDIYVMNADGSGVRRLTGAPGYDGGPFFSADGQKITWRRFAQNGAAAEIFTMNADGSGQKQITRLGVMSWAPFFHPSGGYIVFSTNLHGMDNFELYAVDAEGEKEPVRITNSPGFDGLPAFSQDGEKLAWTSGRSANKTSQIFLAGWNDALIRQRLGLPAFPSQGKAGKQETKQEITAKDMQNHVAFLAASEMEGRLAGSEGERKAADYVAAAFGELGLEADGDNGKYVQSFNFAAGAALGQDNRLIIHEDGRETALIAGKDWRPLAFSRTGASKPAEVVFAGYGIAAPQGDGEPEYDSYAGLDLEGKWALILRRLPENIGAKLKRRLLQFSDLQYKAAAARRKGALGVIIASGPKSGDKEQLVRLSFEPAGGIAGGYAVSITDQAADALLAASGKNLALLQQSLDNGEPGQAFLVKGVKVSANIDIRYASRGGHNVLGRLRLDANPKAPYLVIGAHLDHLGRGEASSSLARGEEKGKVHPGADDNASGVAGLIEIARYLSALKAAGLLMSKLDIVFAAWSGEELGLLGSQHYVKKVADGVLGGDAVHDDGIHSEIAAYINLDMIGRLEDRLYLQGTDSSPAWLREIERGNVPVGLSVAVGGDSYLPTDSTSFYLRNVPVLSAFTGAHGDYHTPRDTPDKLNYQGAAKIAKLAGSIALALARAGDVPEYVKTERPKGAMGTMGRKNAQVYLGTIPDYAGEGIKGVKITGTAKDSPAEQAGLKAGDIIVGLEGAEIGNIYEFMNALAALKAGNPARINVKRGENNLQLSITPQTRD